MENLQGQKALENGNIVLKKRKKDIPNIVISVYIEHQKNIEAKLETMRNLILIMCPII